MVPADPSPDPETESVILDFPDTDDNRLRRALRDLEAAMHGQSGAVGDLRANLAELGEAVARLRVSTASLSAALNEAAQRNAEAASAVKTLEATATTLEDLSRR